MRWLPCFLALAASAGSARAVDIVEVLQRSQQKRLEALHPADDGPRSHQLQAAFGQLRQALAPGVDVELRVVTGPTMAETLHGRVIVVNEALALMPEGVRSFILAHELGHVVREHWLQVGMLYKRFVPGDVVPETTDPVAGSLGRAASGQAHRHEFEADAFALAAMQQLGRSPQDALAAFTVMGMQQDTATHPGTRKRIAWLRAVQAGVQLPSTGDAE